MHQAQLFNEVNTCSSYSTLHYRFGCCSDGETPAGGPDGEGCDENKQCANSKFGCCPDKVTFAQGPSKQGCFECPDQVRLKTP